MTSIGYIATALAVLLALLSVAASRSARRHVRRAEVALLRAEAVRAAARRRHGSMG